MSIRAIYGKRGSGKDTLYKYINNGLETPCSYTKFEGDEWLLTQPGERIGVADNLKEYVSSITGISLAALEAGKDTQYYNGVLYRQLLENHRHDKDWMEIALLEIDPKSDYIITDLRYKKDLKVLRKICAEQKMDLFLIKMERDGGLEPYKGECELEDEKFDLVVGW